MYRKFSKPLGLIILMVLICLLPAAVLAAPIGKISHLEGEVDITAPGAKTVLVKLNDPVSVGDILRTKAKSKVEVAFLDGNAIFIAERSRLRISEYDTREDKKSTLDLLRGKTRVVVNNIARKSSMDLRTPTAVAGVRGTIWIGSFMNGVSTFTFERGEGYGYNRNMPDKIVTIRAGQAMEVTAPDRLPVVRPATANELKRNLQDTTASDLGQNKQETESASPAPGEDPDAPPPVPTPPLPPLPPPPEPTPPLPPLPPPLEPTPPQPIGSSLQTPVTGLTGFTGTFDGLSTGGPISLTGAFSPYPPTGPGTTGISGTGFDGYLAGIPGSWEGLFDSLYREGNTVSFLTGSLSDPAFTGTTLNAMGTLTRTGAYAIPTGGLYEPFSDGPMLLFRDISAVPPVSEELSLAHGYRTTAGGIIAVGAAVTTGGSYAWPGGENSPPYTWTWQFGAYRQSDISNPYVFLGDITGADDGAGHITLENTTPTRYMDTVYSGTIDLRYRGVYTDSMGYDSIGTAVYDLQPLAFNGEPLSSSSFWFFSLVEGSVSMVEDTETYLSGLIGGTQTLFGAIGADGLYPAVPVYGLGTYDNFYSRPLFLALVEGKDPTTLDLPNYNIFVGGVAGATTLSGGMQGLYWKPGSSAGTYELGLLTGISGNQPASLYPDLATPMWKLADGTQLQAYRLYDNLAPSVSPTIQLDTSAYTNLNILAQGIEGWPDSTSLAENAREGRHLRLFFDTAEPWGVTALAVGGTYEASNPPPSGAQWYQVESVSSGTVGERLRKIAITDVQANLFEAQMAGAEIYWGTTPAWTGVVGGTMTGQFDPTASTWQAVALSTWIETSAFMDKVSGMTDDQRTAFYKATNIPAFNVGSTDLRGYSDLYYINLGSATDPSLGIKNVTFFAPTSGAKPQIWASGNVQGTYAISTPSGTVDLLGYAPGAGSTGSAAITNGITATFTVQKWSGTTWGATVTSGNVPARTTGFSYTNSGTTGITFQGGAAGTFTGTTGTTGGTFSGTAAGIVK